MRSLLAITITATMVLLLSSGPLAAQNVVTLKFPYEGTEMAIKGRSATLLNEKVKEYSGGTLTIDIYPGSSLIPAKDEVRAVIRGQVDIVSQQTSYHVPYNPAWDLFYQPLLFDSAKEGMDTFSGSIGQELLDSVQRVGLRGLGAWHDGPGYLYSTEKPVTEPKQLVGRNVRVFPSAPLEEAIRLAGGIPVSMPGPDVFLAIQQKLVTEAISSIAFSASQRWYEVVVAATRMPMFVGGYAVVINENSWKKLSPEHQEILVRAMDEVNQWNYEETFRNILAAEKIMMDNGVQLVDLTPEQLAEWRATFAPVYEKQPPEIRELTKRIQDARKN